MNTIKIRIKNIEIHFPLIIKVKKFLTQLYLKTELNLYGTQKSVPALNILADKFFTSVTHCTCHEFIFRTEY